MDPYQFLSCLKGLETRLYSNGICLFFKHFLNNHSSELLEVGSRWNSFLTYYRNILDCFFLILLCFSILIIVYCCLKFLQHKIDIFLTHSNIERSNEIWRNFKKILMFHPIFSSQFSITFSIAALESTAFFSPECFLNESDCTVLVLPNIPMPADGFDVCLFFFQQFGSGSRGPCRC